jgi:acetyl-CoA synthetase
MTDPVQVWAEARRRLDGLPDGRGLNIAHEAVDRHVLHGHGDRVALRLLSRNGDRTELTYAALAEATARFAGALDALGVRSGDTVFVLLPRRVELYVAVLGALKHGCIACPLFSAFGPGPVTQRLALGHGRVLVTTAALYERSVAAQRAELPELRHVLVTDDEAPAGTSSLPKLTAAAPPVYEIAPTAPDQPALLHFTSGTTGTPKGAVHVHEAVVAHDLTGRDVLGLSPGEVFWCTADPGWVTGTSYGIVAPLTNGVTSIVDEADFDAARWYRILADEAVSIWYTAPTAIRMLMRAGTDVATLARPRPALRLAFSVGEPLPPDAVRWGEQVLGLAFRDTWWQTETGGIMVANDPGRPVQPGSMGRAVPGVTVAVVRCGDDGEVVLDGDGRVVAVTDPAEQGMLVIRPGWPSMFRGYLDRPERYAASFVGPPDDRWYVTGDVVRADADGTVWFVARADDVIKTAGHLIGPFEVERTLMEHPDVVDAGVYGVPDPVAGAVVHAVVVPRSGVTADETLRRSVVAHARRRLGAAVAPRDVRFATDLPKTRSGKVMRRVLRARELGLPEGDTSTLETTTA